jgi:hypothetical protein
MRSRTNFAPTGRTIIVALILMLAGLLCSYGGFVDPHVGIACFLLATALLLVGMVTREL